MAWIGLRPVSGGGICSLAFVVCMVLAGFAGVPAASMGASGPVVSSELVSQVSEHAATLEAQIDPNGLETKYEFWLQYKACQSGQSTCDTIVVTRVEEGYVGAFGTNVHVTASLTGLQAGYSYTYFVYAVNGDGFVKGESLEFVATNGGGGSLKTEPTVPPEPDNQATPYQSTIETGLIGQYAAEAAQREFDEHRREQEQREAKEKEEAEHAAATAMCRVPRLKGDSLKRAKATLIRNHCRVGRVTRHRASGGTLIVIAQSHPYGAQLPKGSTVALRLGS
jgi:hypothetical protein